MNFYQNKKEKYPVILNVKPAALSSQGCDKLISLQVRLNSIVDLDKSPTLTFLGTRTVKPKQDYPP